jgi:uncharacterized protein with PQ loop repeat
MLSLPPGAADASGYLAATLTTASWIPQIVRTWRSRSAGDLSLGMLATFTLGIALWLVFGLARRRARSSQPTRSRSAEPRAGRPAAQFGGARRPL